MQLISEDMLTDSDSEAADPVSEEVFFGNTSEVKVEDVISELVEKDAQTSRNIAAMQESVSKVADRQNLCRRTEKDFRRRYQIRRSVIRV
ncbi:MAG: hypothetical protein V8S42_03340 [Lachnospiraceae bacterium]